MRAFVFSLDAFIAFTIALMAIYSLIFFSSVPSAYYFLLTQAHFLSMDGLLVFSNAQCEVNSFVCRGNQTLLEAVIRSEGERDTIVKSALDEVIPPQFGYTFEVKDLGGEWERVYSTEDDPSTLHSRSKKRLSVSTEMLYIAFVSEVPPEVYSPYQYLSCPGASGGVSAVRGGSGLLITCVSVAGEGGERIPALNVPPEDLSDVLPLPESEIKVVRLTVFI